MANEIQPTRQYTEREVRLILKTAVEMQQERADRAGELAGGMSLTELEQVAVEAGLDPAYVRRAAAQLNVVVPPAEQSVFLGGPSHIVIERVVNVAIDPGRFDQLLDVVRGVTHEVGEVSTVGRQFGWKGRMDGAKTEANVSAGDRSSTIRVRVELDEVALGHFMLKGTLFGIGGGLIGTGIAVTVLGPLAFGVGAVMLGTGYVWARTGFRGAGIRYRARANELIDALDARATEISRETRPA
jgi:hypothetical protein